MCVVSREANFQHVNICITSDLIAVSVWSVCTADSWVKTRLTYTNNTEFSISFGTW